MLNNCQGMVLVSVMLLLVVTSLLALTLLNTSFLEAKMSHYYQNKFQAFYLAEKYLEQYEQEILLDNKLTNANIIANDGCVTFYRVIAISKYNAVYSKLQSTVAKVSASCNPLPRVKQGRQSFLVVY